MQPMKPMKPMNLGTIKHVCWNTPIVQYSSESIISDANIRENTYSGTIETFKTRARAQVEGQNALFFTKKLEFS